MTRGLLRGFRLARSLAGRRTGLSLASVDIGDGDSCEKETVTVDREA